MRVVALSLLALVALPAASSSAAAGAQVARTHAICSGPNSAKVPCRFSTPSGDVRCIWTPAPNAVSCKLRGTGRAYRLKATGKAKSVRLTVGGPVHVLPLNQQIVFPDSLSCHDTRRAMTCNQDFGTGAFTLSPRSSHRS
ncbi:MAG TPA: hypothetical protein VHT25_09220 [Solirubrobacteraceae bacterium]|jgi:hypothetical protein|nr:hypothetical protein [Solirubrobacteraceae bacterium]